MSTNWLEISFKLSKFSLWESPVAIENVMHLFLQQIESLLESEHQSPKRIWTLHKIVDNQIHFYRSSEIQRLEQLNAARKINDGLIGKAIERQTNFVIFENAKEVQGYIEGWEDCKSELIILIRNQTERVIGVINIESDIFNDFDFSNRGRTTEEEINSFFLLVSNHLSMIFKKEALIQEQTYSSSLIQDLSISPISSSVRLERLVEGIFAWLKSSEGLSRAVFYITDLENRNLYKRVAKYGKFIISPEITPDVQEVRHLFEPRSHSIRKDQMIQIFNEDFVASFIKDLDKVNIYFDGVEICSNHQNASIKYFVGIILDENQGVLINDQVRKCFDILKSITTRYLNNQVNARNSFLNETVIEMYQKTLEYGDFRITLNEISDIILSRTKSQFCLIYLLDHHSRYQFYLGGASGREASDFADIRFNQEVGIAAHVLKSKESYYHEDFYKCKINGNLLNNSLLYKNLEKPEIFAYPLIQSSDLPVGVIMLLRDVDVRSRDDYAKNQVTKLLADWSKNLSEIIYSGQDKLADCILCKSYERMVENIFPTVENLQSSDLLFNISVQVTDEILPIWNGILNPAYFVVYKKNGNMFEIFNDKVISPSNVSSRPPTFKMKQGLTGTVMDSKNREIYVPFVEDVERHTDTSEKPIPDGDCKAFWDDVSAGGRRMYYGRHINVDDEDYILIIIGVRDRKFSPPLGYRLAHDLTDTIYKYIKSHE